MATLAPKLLQAYLQRVGRPGIAPEPSLQSLATLHTAHLQAIPFENLSLRLEAAKQHDVDLRLERIHAKLVGSNRGGFCFEHNALFAAVLRTLGFDVVEGGARVVMPGPPPEPAADGAAAPELAMTGVSHHVLFVQLEGRIWLADVGFGGECPALPILLPEGAERYAAPGPAAAAADAYAGLGWSGELPTDRLRRYRLRLGVAGALGLPDPATVPLFGSRVGYYLQARSQRDGRWKDLYFFRLDEYLPTDYRPFCLALTADPGSLFRTSTLVGLQTAEGRVTLFDSEFKRWVEGEPVEVRQVEGEEQLLALLDAEFGMRF